MFRRILIFSLFLYFLVLLQTNFLVHFRFWGIVPNFILIFVILINIFESPSRYSGLFAGFLGGLLLDIFSSSFLGLNVLILLSITFFIKLILRKYVWVPVR